ncbi:hypothetical protein CBR_g23714 [Chara braunii]|uniref:Oxidoreductase FAD/NAD(P)-binding domain-containing protein n=1 Tax=Chara braunii TaxID=69332 RepID=A0A388L5B3_CHABU|nr:hypothetical protein CBR_g23714 [Chara braunii]|eukprot:GBG77383.1 hypothetical protein CBR_g23714 [Chara braunii]
MACGAISTAALQKTTPHLDVFSGMEQTMRAVRLPLQGTCEQCCLQARGRGAALFFSHHGQQIQDKARKMTGGMVQKMQCALTEVMTTRNGMEYTVNKSRTICGGQRASARGYLRGLSSVSASLPFRAQNRERRWSCLSGTGNGGIIRRKEGSRMPPRVVTDLSPTIGCTRKRQIWRHCVLMRPGRMAAVTPRASWSTQVEFKEAHLANVEEVATQLWNLTVDISKLDIGNGYTRAGQYLQMKVGESKPAFLAIASPPSYAESGVLEFLVKDVEGATSELLCDLSKALIESGFDALKRTDVRLYYGAANSSKMAYQDRFRIWRASGVNIVPVFSDPDESWDGAVGYVQDVISLLTDEGVQRDKVLMNF